MSLGDTRSYLLTTAENELGVVLAQSEAGKYSGALAYGKLMGQKKALVVTAWLPLISL